MADHETQFTAHLQTLLALRHGSVLDLQMLSELESASKHLWDADPGRGAAQALYWWVKDSTGATQEPAQTPSSGVFSRMKNLFRAPGDSVRKLTKAEAALIAAAGFMEQSRMAASSAQRIALMRQAFAEVTRARAGSISGADVLHARLAHTLGPLDKQVQTQPREAASGGSADSVIVEACQALGAHELPKLLNMAKTHLNMRGWMNPVMLVNIIATTGRLLQRNVQNPGALALLGYATIATGDTRAEPNFERAQADATGTAALCGHYFRALLSFRSKAQADDVEGAGQALVDGLLPCMSALTDQTVLKFDLKSLEFGHCIIVSTDQGGLVVPVQGYEERFAQRQ